MCCCLSKKKVTPLSICKPSLHSLSPINHVPGHHHLNQPSSNIIEMSLNQLKNVVLPWYRPAPIPPVQKGRVQSCISLISKYWKKWWNPTQEAVAKDNIQAHQDKNTINVQIPSWIARKRVKIVIIGVHGTDYMMICLLFIAIACRLVSHKVAPTLYWRTHWDISALCIENEKSGREILCRLWY